MEFTLFFRAYRIAFIAAVSALCLFVPAITVHAATSISTCEGLQNISDDITADYILANDIDCSGIDNFSQIGSAESIFTGTLDGQGYVIRNLSVSTTYAGMIYGIGSGGRVQNLGFENPDIDASTYSGVLASRLQGGSVSHVYVANGTLNCGNAYCGGLIGYMYTAGSVVTSSYSNVSILSGSTKGGIVGRFSTGTIDMVYASGAMTGLNKRGIIGSVDSGVTPDISSSYYDEEITTATDNGYGTPTSTAAMMTQSTFSDWDFTVAGDGTVGEWIMAGYPHLQMEHRSTITDVIELQLIAVDRTDDYTFANNIDAASTTAWNGGAGFMPIGDNSAQFTGSVDGNGYTISDIYINRPDEYYVTLIGYLNAAGSMTHIKITGADFTGDRYVTGFVGVSYGSLSKLSFSGDIAGDSVLAGITGENGGTLTESQSSGTITGSVNSYYLGGIAGNNVGTLTNSYSSMSVSGKDLVGGLVGDNYNDGTIRYSYAIGAISGTTNVGGLVGRNYFSSEEEELEGTVENSFYNSTTSGQSDIDKGTGKTTAQMKTLANYTDTDTSGLDTAWDFVGTPYDDEGTSSIWEMDPALNSGYAFLAWEQSDSNAPSAVTSVSGSASEDDISLTWTNPTDSDFVSISVRRGTSDYPASVSSGTSVLSATTTTSLSQTSLEDGRYYYSIFALDNTGNVSNAATTSITVDITPPTITLLGSASISQNKGQAYTDAGATAFDTVDGDISGSITTSGVVNTTIPGTYTITYSVSDEAGNAAATVTRTVTILSVGGGGGSFSTPRGTGSGASDQFVDMYKTKYIGEIPIDGVNLLTYLEATALFSLAESATGKKGDHQLTITDLDLSEKKEVVFVVSSDPQTISLKLGASTNIDIDGDGISDLSATFVALWNNRVELTLKPLSNTDAEHNHSIDQPTSEGSSLDDPYIIPCPSPLFTMDIHKGYSGQSALALQRYLNSVGVYVALSGPGSPGNETTYFGSLTEQAMKNFQKNHGLAETGIFDEPTRKMLGCTTVKEEPASIISFARDLSYGMQGSDVRQLQVYLNSHGFPVAASGYGSAGNETLYFGDLTRQAVIAFQISKGIIPSSGYVGSRTREKMQ